MLASLGHSEGLAYGVRAVDKLCGVPRRPRNKTMNNFTLYTFYGSLNPNSLDNKGSWRILKDFYCLVTMLRELGLIVDLSLTPVANFCDL